MSQDFLDEHYDIPKITMVNNVIHNNEGYGVVLVKPTIFSDLQENAQDETEGMVYLVIFKIKTRPNLLYFSIKLWLKILIFLSSLKKITSICLGMEIEKLDKAITLWNIGVKETFKVN